MEKQSLSHLFGVSINTIYGRQFVNNFDVYMHLYLPDAIPGIYLKNILILDTDNLGYFCRGF